jgi:SAM-dependent methyltransferase
MSDGAGDHSGAPGRPEQDFDQMYRGEAPPWDIGRPQPAFAALADAGRLREPVLDIGCGTGEHALMAARLGLETVGIDASPTAIAMARDKADRLGLEARFEVADALALGDWPDSYETVLDSGLFHVFDDGDRVRYVDSLGHVVRPGGTYLLMCFSDRQPGDWGPRRVTQGEIRLAFSEGWRVESIEAAIFDIRPPIDRAEAWLATITAV